MGWDWLTTRSRRAALLLFVAMSLLGVSACRSPDASPTPVTETAMGWLHTVGARLVSADGAEQRIRAVSWFGLETQTCAPHGLRTISVDAAVRAMADMGFNTIRLPYSSECLRSGSSTGIDAAVNPELVGASPLQVMDFVVDRAAQHQLSVILDRHRLNSNSQSDLWYDDRYPEKTWIDDWTMLARRYADTATVIGADLQNEPHGAACWGCGDPAIDWAGAATRAGNAILAVNPHWLIVVEGVERQTTGETTWWGGGLADVRLNPIELTQSSRLVYSPHAYPPSIYEQPWSHDAGYPDNLPALWDRDWGYLQREEVAPVLLGEFGSKLKTKADRQWMSTMVSYLNANGISFGYWAFNPDSQDTGGLVTKNWITPERAKLTALAPLFADQPSSTDVPLPGSASPSPADSATPSALATPPSSSATPSRSASALPGSPSQAATSTSCQAATLAARWSPQSSWAEGYAVNLTLTAGGGPTSGWTLSWPDAQATAIQNAWGASCTVNADRVVCVGKDWGAWVPENGSVTVGVQVTRPGGRPPEPSLSVVRDG